MYLMLCVKNVLQYVVPSPNFRLGYQSKPKAGAGLICSRRGFRNAIR